MSNLTNDAAAVTKVAGTVAKDAAVAAKDVNVAASDASSWLGNKKHVLFVFAVVAAAVVAAKFFGLF